ncbi:hypothetical protein EV209_0217 [Cuneatibacter caecimuris]|uniref:Uncharacterized protein n=1 Tax=Cuneatibacter caecimuris TaxID=1796618 RepID=A0A4Q7PMI5_9FIRM|nr:hypothetical protein EV209_0217 [Cuneatibacter caecimuris]
MSNPNYGFRFIDDGIAEPKKKRVETQSKIFQASKLKKNKKRRFK